MAETDNRRLLLISNSTLHGQGYLDHCEQAIRTHLEGAKKVLFIPYARPSGITEDAYAAKAKERFERMGFEMRSIHEAQDRGILTWADALFVGGGNTFVLLDELQGRELLPNLRRNILDGKPYVGASAGSNVAGKTIMTTNDMPIRYPRHGFEAIGAVSFIINPHYIDPIAGSTHMGETRETRIKEYHVFNSDPVVGLREGAMLRVNGNSMALQGTTNARLFRQGQEPQEYSPGADLSFLLS